MTTARPVRSMGTVRSGWWCDCSRGVHVAIVLLAATHGPALAQQCTGLVAAAGSWGQLGAGLAAADSGITIGGRTVVGTNTAFAGFSAGVAIADEPDGTESTFSGSAMVGVRAAVSDAVELCPILEGSLGAASRAPGRVSGALSAGWRVIGRGGLQVTPGAAVGWSFLRRDQEEVDPDQIRSDLSGRAGLFVGVTVARISLRQQVVRSFGRAEGGQWSVETVVVLNGRLGR